MQRPATTKSSSRGKYAGSTRPYKRTQYTTGSGTRKSLYRCRKSRRVEPHPRPRPAEQQLPCPRRLNFLHDRTDPLCTAALPYIDPTQTAGHRSSSMMWNEGQRFIEMCPDGLQYSDSFSEIQSENVENEHRVVATFRPRDRS